MIGNQSKGNKNCSINSRITEYILKILTTSTESKTHRKQS